MWKKRKAITKISMPVMNRGANQSTKFSIDQGQTLAATNAPTKSKPNKPKQPDTIVISSSEEKDESDDGGYDDSDVEESPDEQEEDAGEENGNEDVELDSAGSQHGKPETQEDDDSDGAPVFGDLVRANDLIDVRPVNKAQSSTILKNCKQIVPPALSSVGTVLSQALRTDDNDLLESCLLVSDINTVRSTIQRLDSILAGALLSKLAERLHRRPGRAGSLMAWLQWALVCHGGAIVKESDRLSRLADVQRVLKMRAEGLPSLLMLKGKLDMLESQMMLRKHVRKQKLGNEQSGDEEDGVVYVEGEEEESHDNMDDATDDRPALVNGVDSDDSEEERDDEDDEDDEQSEVDEVADDDDVNHDDEDSEEGDDSDFVDAAAPPAKIQKIAGCFSSRR